MQTSETYSPVTYYTLGAVWPRERVREVYPRRLVLKVLAAALLPSAPPVVSGFTCASIGVADAYDGVIAISDAFDGPVSFDNGYDGTVEVEQC